MQLSLNARTFSDLSRTQSQIAVILLCGVMLTISVRIDFSPMYLYKPRSIICSNEYAVRTILPEVRCLQRRRASSGKRCHNFRMNDLSKRQSEFAAISLVKVLSPFFFLGIFATRRKMHAPLQHTISSLLLDVTCLSNFKTKLQALIMILLLAFRGSFAIVKKSFERDTVIAREFTLSFLHEQFSPFVTI